MQEHGADTVIERSQCALRLTVLCRGIRAREAESDAVVLEVFAEGEVIEFASIVSLEAKNRQLELARDI